MKWSGRVSAVSLLVPPLVLGSLGWHHRWMSEDAFIVLRVVQNLLAGHGPTWNVDERVEIFTSPVWLGFLTLAAVALRRVRLEWIAVVSGLLCSVGGLLAAERGALLLARLRWREARAWPLGALVVAALPPYWDYATSGLETGLAFAWLGSCFWGLAHLCSRLHRGGAGTGIAEEPHPSRPSGVAAAVPAHGLRGQGWLGLAIGLGPLVRPDLAVIAAGFLLLLLWLCRPAALAQYLLIIAMAAAIPSGYEIFRLGYFATLLPNTALAKEAFGVYWSQGWRYLTDFVGVYWLWIPCLALFAAWLSLLRDTRRARHRAGTALLVVPAACGLLHAVYVVRVGGDFMHGRLLLPSLFTLLLPIAVVAGGRWWRTALPAVVVVPWAIVCAVWLRVPYRDTIGPMGIADERGVHVASIGRPHPVTLEDYDAAYVTYDGRALHRLAQTRRTLLLGSEITPGQPSPAEAALAPWVTTQVVAGRPNVGLLGYAAGPRVHIVDRLGLGDPVAARFRVERRGRPGHEKWLSDAWMVARFADPATGLPSSAPPAPLIAAARAALACPRLDELIRAIEAPLTPAQFLRNVASAWHLRNLAIPSDPSRAVSELCVAG